MPVFIDKRDAIEQAEARPATGLPATFTDGESWFAAFDTLRMENLSMSRVWNLTDAFDEQVAEAAKLGEKLEHPVSLAKTSGVDPYVARSYGLPEVRQPTIEGNFPAFDARIAELRAKYPQARFRTSAEVQTDIEAKARRYREIAADVDERTTAGGKAASVLGGMGAVMSDPVVLSSAAYGAPLATGILKAALIEAGVGMASEALIQPVVFDYKQEIDSPYTVGDAAANVLLAGGGAAGGTLVLRGAKPAAQATGRAVEKGFERSGELLKKFREKYYGKDAQRPPTKMEQAAEKVLERAEAMEASTPFPRTVEGDVAHTRNMEAAVAAAVDAKVAEILPPPAPLAGRVTGSGLERLDPSSIGVDARRFQFKSDADAQGVTDRLVGVDKFDERLAGVALVYEDAAGKAWIVDGHQRLALARRAKEAGQEGVALNAYMLREADGVSDAQARAIAAFKNIAEGTGSAVDTAKIIREAGAAGLPQLPPRSMLVRDGRALAELSDDAFGIVINAQVPANYAAIVGRLVKDKNLHASIVDVLRRTDPANATQAESIVRQAMEAGSATTKQVDLFGETMLVENLYAERARIIDAALNMARRDKAVFRTLVERERSIEQAGNVLSKQANIARLTDDEKLIETIQRLANTRGPISDALEVSARGIKTGERSVRDAAGDFLGAVRERGAFGGDTGGSAGGGGRAAESYTGTPDPVVRMQEVAGEAERMAKAADAPPDLTDAVQTSMLDVGDDVRVPIGERIDPDTGARVSETVSARELLEMVDDAEQAAREIKGCIPGGGA